MQEKKLSNGFRELRLAAARAILCNGKHLLYLRQDIQHADHVLELSEEYVFRAIFLWLVTTYGSARCESAIASDLTEITSALVDTLALASEYPFANSFDQDSFKPFQNQAFELLDGFAYCQIELIGSLYEHLYKYPMEIDSDGLCHIKSHIQEKNKRRLAGQFYTPPEIVDYCFDKAVGKDQDRLGRILDPSCGTGNFLLGAVRLFASAVQAPSDLVELAGTSLYGLELDGRAAALTRSSLILSLMPAWHQILLNNRALPGSAHFSRHQVQLRTAVLALLKNLRAHIKVADTLFAAPSSEGESSLPWYTSAEQFSLVITNPPYLSFGARNQPKLDSSSAKYLRHEFPDSAEYKIRIHSIFQDIAVRYLEPQGIATLLVPDGFLTGGYYGRLRQLLLDKSQLQSFAELPSDTVPGAVVGRWCVATYGKTDKASSDYSIDLYSLAGNENLHYRLQKSALVSADCHRFRLVFNDIDRDLCCFIDSLEPLSCQMRGHTGIRALRGQSSVVGDARHGDNWRPGLRSGSAVQPHLVTWDGTWLHIDADLLYRGGFDAKVIGNAKLLVRQTGDRLIAAYDDSGLYHLNNIHSLSPLTGSNLDLEFVDGLLGSNLWLYLYRLKTREHGRALAQIDIETLESMPLPGRNPKTERLISLFVGKLRTARNLNQQSKRIQRSIDRLVYDLYTLEEPVVEQIERGCGKLSSAEDRLPLIEELRQLEAWVLSSPHQSEGALCPSPTT